MAFNELHGAVSEVISFLEECGDRYVPVRLRNYLSGLEVCRPQAVRSLYSECTGSMGSLNDRVIAEVNGDHAPGGDYAAANQRLRQLVHKVYALAVEAGGAA